MTRKTIDKHSFAIFKNLDSDVIDSIIEELWERLVPKKGASKSIQGELVRAFGRLELEGSNNGNLNWTSAKFDLNCDRYPKGYIPAFPDDDFIPGSLDKCSATKTDLDNVSHFDEMLNFLKSWFAANPLPEWSLKHQAKIQAVLERGRPDVPVGVISDEHWESYCEKRKCEKPLGFYYEDLDFIKTQIAYWIYRNPDLIDANGNSLKKSVASTIEPLVEELWE